MCINPVHFWPEFRSASALALDGRMCPSPKRMQTLSEYGTSSTEAFPRDGSVNNDCPTLETKRQKMAGDRTQHRYFARV